MKIIECPRDAMQGLEPFIPTEIKIRYINQLLKVGFNAIDFGSFVSAKAIPQLRDTVQVLEQLEWRDSQSKLLAIVANTRGAHDASAHEAITYIGFPLSLSETFQQRNTNKSIEQALNTVEEIQDVCFKTNKKLVTYISMGFGNPYGDAYDVELVANFVDILMAFGVDVISLSDTIGVATPQDITFLVTSLLKHYPGIALGLHLHSNPRTALDKIDAAYKAGCKRFDGALKGYGGCPMADDELVGNLATETIVGYLQKQGELSTLNQEAFTKALIMADEIFPKH